MEELTDNGATEGGAVVTLDPSGNPVIKLSGEIDISNVDAVRATVLPVVDTQQTCVVFDLSTLDFMDSSGIALMLQVAARSGSVELHEPSAIVRRIIETTGLSDVLRIAP